jgi:hypothetical protein
MVADYVPVDFTLFKVNHWEILELGNHRNPPAIKAPTEYVEYSWNITATSWPYGTSLLAGLGQTLEITEQLITDINAYLHKAAFPGGLFQIGDENAYPDPDDLATMQSKIANWEPGFNYATSYAVDYKVVGPASAETRILNDVITYLKERLIDGLMMAPVSKQYSRTMASMEQMQDQSFLSVVLPVQRLLKRVIERQVYRPYLEQLGYSVLNVPKVSFTPPDEDRDEQAAYYIPLVRTGLITREAAARELGIEDVDVPSEEDLMAMQPQQGGDDEDVKTPESDTEDQLQEMLARVRDGGTQNPEFFRAQEKWVTVDAGTDSSRPVWIDDNSTNSVQQKLDYIKSVKDELPSSHSKNIKQIQVKTKVTHDYYGTFRPWESKIIIREDALEERSHARHVIYHEVGHSLYQEVVWAKTDNWVDFWNGNESIMPNGYSQSNPSEGFAECYAYYNREKFDDIKTVPLHKDIVAWFDRNLGKDYE